ncbi:MAG TPA: hypothetical protein VNY73_08135, partial [Bacteroidia bacterium]|nr:hypothetical protein [Bacteroidia bacterium]
MKRYFPSRWLSGLLLLILCMVGHAQKSSIYVDADGEFKTGMELFDKKKFGSALKNFQNTIESNKNPKSLVRIDAEYYAAACAIELFNKDGE